MDDAAEVARRCGGAASAFAYVYDGTVRRVPGGEAVAVLRGGNRDRDQRVLDGGAP